MRHENQSSGPVAIQPKLSTTARAGLMILSILALVLAATSAMAACQYKRGDVVAFQEADGDWRKSRVMGYSIANGQCTYRITGPGGETDYANPESGVAEARLMDLATAEQKGLIPKPKPSPQSVQIDPAATDVRQLERAILKATNQARTQPASFATEIQTKIVDTYQTKTFADNSQQLWVTPPGESTSGYNMPTEANAYKGDVTSAQKFLKSQTALPALTWSEGLARAARDHARDPNIKGHTGGDGSTAFQRMARYGTGGRAENLGANHTTAFGFLSSFVIDFRVPSRGHRVNIFNSSYTNLGVGCHYFAPADPHYLGFIRCVMTFGQSYQDKTGVAPAAGIAYVANLGDGTVTMIDVASEKTLTTLSGVGVNPAWVAVGPYGHYAYVTSKGKKLAVIDAVKKSVGPTWDLPHEPHGAVVSPDGNHIYVGAYELGPPITGYILKYDIQSGKHKLSATLPVGHNPGALAMSRNGKRLYVSDGDGPGFYLDLAKSNSLHTLGVNGQMVESADGSRLFAGVLFTIWSADTANWQTTVLDSLPTSNRQIMSVALCPGDRLYATEVDMVKDAGSVVIFGPQNRRVAKRVDLPGTGWMAACALDGTKLFITHPAGNDLFVFDTATEKTTSLKVGRMPLGIAIGPAPTP